MLYNETRKEYRHITKYDAFSHIAKVDGSIEPLTTWMNDDEYCFRREPPCSYGDVVNATINTVEIAATEPSDDITYFHYFIRMINGVADNESRYITKYDGATKTATINKPFDGGIPAPGDMYEILPFSYDNAFPFVYSGSLVSQQEEVCYQIELMNLIFTQYNIGKTGYGSRIAFLSLLLCGAC